MQIGIFMANGMEEVECLTVVDLLRRAGIKVVTIAIGEDKMVTGAHKICVMADELLKDIDCNAFEGVVLPGGMPGTIYLKENAKVCQVVKEFVAANKLIAAICAAPTVFGEMGLLKGKNATCYPGMEEGLLGANWKTEKVVVDGNIITSRGVGTAIDFGLEIIRYLMKDETANRIAEQIVYK